MGMGMGMGMRMVPRALEYVRALNRKVIIVTNCNRGVAEELVRRCGLAPLVKAIVVGAECARPKPHPDPYLEAFRLAGVTADRAVVYDDSAVGVASAVAAEPLFVVGIETCLSREELVGLGAHRAAPDYRALDMPCASRDSLALRALLMRTARSLGAVDVVVNEGKLKGGFVSDVYDVTVVRELGEDVRCVFKCDKAEAESDPTARRLDLYDREVLFYERIFPLLNRRPEGAAVRTPECHGIARGVSGGRSWSGVLLENLTARRRRRMRIGVDLASEPALATFNVLDRLARLHASSPALLEQSCPFPELRRNDDALFRPSWGDFVRGRWPEFSEKWADRLGETALAAFGRAVEGFDAAQARLSRGPLTLCHGDVKSANIFFDGACEPHFIDWQYVVLGKGAQDVAFFLIESFDAGFMRARRAELTDAYYDRLVAHATTSAGGSEGAAGAAGAALQTRAQFEEELEVAAAYFPIFVAMWFGTKPADELVDLEFPARFVERLASFLTWRRPPVGPNADRTC